MVICQAENIARYYQKDPVFSELSFQIRAGDRIGLVGPNGAGKTTLLSLLVKDAVADYGTLWFAPETSVRLLRQIPNFNPGATLLQEAHRAMEHLETAYRAMVAAGDRIATATDEADRRRWSEEYDRLNEFLARHGGYEFGHRIEEVLVGIGFAPEDFDRTVDGFSGGQRSRIMLAQLLLASPDLMLLDEPTNHLDVEAIEWLEGYLRRQESAMVIVSHDRYFLDKSADKMFEMHAGKLTIYPGNYSAYAKLRTERQLVNERVAVKHQEQIAHYQDFVNRNKYGQLAKQAKSREKMIARIEEELVETIRDVSGPRMFFGAADRAGDVVAEAHGVGMEFPGKPLFANFNFAMQRGERLGLAGPNGAGKTTLLRILLGELEPTAGKARLGHNVKVGYLDQNLALLDPEKTPLEAVRPPWRLTEKPEPFRALLARFGIGADLAEKTIGVLSGGERTRVALARICAHEVNLLALDEPTNHLDPWACESLEAALAEFDGSVLVVSHDRAFLENVVDRLLYVADGEVKLIAGGYEKLVEYRTAKAAAAKNPEAKSPAKSKPLAKDEPSKSKRKFPYRKAADVEADIHTHEGELAEWESKLVDPDVYRDGRKVKEVGDRIAELKTRIAELYEHWQQAVELNW